MFCKFDSHTKYDSAGVLEKLCVKEQVGEFIKVDSDILVLKVPCRIYDTLKMFLLVLVYYDKKTRKDTC